MLQWMRGRQWVLKPHVIAVEGSRAKANLFMIPGGWAIPVVYGKAARVRVHIRVGETDLKEGVPRTLSFTAWYPGQKEGVALKALRAGDETVIELPLVRGCAMVVCR
ncbi:MAG: hypothetical protein P4L51_02975 [Puia sp.]|nr:hypothetical protein [Puia sp.]